MTKNLWEDVCPFCGSSNTQGVDGMLPEFDVNAARFFMECWDCNKAWYDVYMKAFQENQDGFDLKDEEK